MDGEVFDELVKLNRFLTYFSYLMTSDYEMEFTRTSARFVVGASIGFVVVAGIWLVLTRSV